MQFCSVYVLYSIYYASALLLLYTLVSNNDLRGFNNSSDLNLVVISTNFQDHYHRDIKF